MNRLSLTFTTHCAGATLLKSDAECLSLDIKLGNFTSAKDCANACRSRCCIACNRAFGFGFDIPRVHARHLRLPTGWRLDVGSINLRKCVWCRANRPGCRFFIYGKKGARVDLSGTCFFEKTQASCSEGFEVDSYDFYILNTG